MTNYLIRYMPESVYARLIVELTIMGLSYAKELLHKQCMHEEEGGG